MQAVFFDNAVGPREATLRATLSGSLVVRQSGALTEVAAASGGDASERPLAARPGSDEGFIRGPIIPPLEEMGLTDPPPVASKHARRTGGGVVGNRGLKNEANGDKEAGWRRNAADGSHSASLGRRCCDCGRGGCGRGGRRTALVVDSCIAGALAPLRYRFGYVYCCPRQRDLAPLHAGNHPLKYPFMHLLLLYFYGPCNTTYARLISPEICEAQTSLICKIDFAALPETLSPSALTSLLLHVARYDCHGHLVLLLRSKACSHLLQLTPPHASPGYVFDHWAFSVMFSKGTTAAIQHESLHRDYCAVISSARAPSPQDMSRLKQAIWLVQANMPTSTADSFSFGAVRSAYKMLRACRPCEDVMI